MPADYIRKALGSYLPAKKRTTDIELPNESGIVDPRIARRSPRAALPKIVAGVKTLQSKGYLKGKK